MRKLTALFVTLAWLGSAGAAEIYCSQATRDCSDRPTPGADRVAGTETLHRVDDAAAAGNAGQPAAKSPAKAPPPDAPPSAGTKRAVQNDVAAARAEQCKKAQDDYQHSIIARRIYNEDKDGNRVYLSDDEADAARVRARQAVQDYCGAAPEGG
ncbi:MAG TPA: hypothetical protein VF848_07275 [Steroidobacteraceae bacterium]